MAETPAEASPNDTPSRLPEGTRVEVRGRFDRSWSKGFTVAEATSSGYRLQRDTDGAVLPVEFSAGDVRQERSRSLWWV